MYETMTVHRAMVELKTIDKRIAKKIENAAFCTSAKVNMKKLFGQPAEEFMGHDSHWSPRLGMSQRPPIHQTYMGALR